MKNNEDKITHYIGIDPGTNTGIAIWSVASKSFLTIDCVKIHKAMEMVLSASGKGVCVRFEDARLRTWFGKSGREVLQGVGSIKRDCAIWEDFLLDKNIKYFKVKPKAGQSKWSSDYFKKVTGWTKRINEHSRDAAVLVFQK